MIKKFVLIILLVLPMCLVADDMDEAYARAKSKGAENNAESIRLIRETKPVYDETNTPEVDYRSELISQ